MSLPQSPVPTPAEQQRGSPDQLYSRMLASASALISFYARQIPGCAVNRQLALTRTMRRIRNDRAEVIAFDQAMILTYTHRFDAQLAAEQEARQSS